MMFDFTHSKSLITKFASVALLGAMFALPLSATGAQADPGEIQLDISPSFDWSAASIRKLAYNTASVFSDRCENQCTIRVRVMIKENARRVSDKHMQWLRQNLSHEMGKKTGATILVQDKLFFV